MRQHRIAVIPGDGIGKEVIPAGLTVLEALQNAVGGFELHTEIFPWGSDFYRATGRMLPEDGLDILKPFDAIYFGSVGDPHVPDHITLWGLRLAICQGFDQYANVRPTRILPGIVSPLRDVADGDLDWVIVRENSEGEYAGHGGRSHRGLPEEVATETAVFTRAGTQRILRFGFEMARSRKRKMLTVVTKSNAQRNGMVFWDEIALQVSRDYPDVTWDKMLVDAMTTRMVGKLGGGARRQHGHRAYGESESGTPLSVDVRTHSRLSLRHHGEGNCQSYRQLLDGGSDAGTSAGARSSRTSDAGD